MKRRLILGGFIVAVTSLSYVFLFPKPGVTPSFPMRSLVKPIPPPSVGIPATLIAPTIGLTAAIEEVGRTAKGEMDVPSSGDKLGWYKFGVVPGAAGPAVLAGHTGYPNQPTRFRKLQNLKIGDPLKIEDVHGVATTFEVTELATYTPSTAPRQRIFGKTDETLLTIITCTGDWIENEKTYSHRLVVYARKRG